MKTLISVVFFLLIYGDGSLTEPAMKRRSPVAVRKSSSEVFISWRLLPGDTEKTAFNIYRNGDKINSKPLRETCFTDRFDGKAHYLVKTVEKGKERPGEDTCSSWKDLFREIPLNRPAGGTMDRSAPGRSRPGQTPQRQNNDYTYSPGDASAGDLDGDGEYEIVLKWDPSNARDNASDGFSAPVIIDAYKLSGKQLWRINLGKNIRAGAHYTQLMVFDLDGDGKAEVACKTADGTTDGKGKIIGNAEADWRNERGKILDGPEYLTVFSGLTGENLCTVDYVPSRGDQCKWGNNECNGNRVDRFLACIAFLDGEMPSLVMCRGYYGRLTLCAWDFRKGSLKQKWFFDSDNGYQEYMGQGNHNLSVADIDSDGKDEIVYGSSAYDHDGKPVYSTGMGHGDAMHLADIDPSVPGLEVWGVKEGEGLGSVLHSASNGKTLLHIKGEGDTGRGLAADIYPDYPGLELWSSTSGGIFSCTGTKITDAKPSVNFRIFWDGDREDELLDRSFVDDWDYRNHVPVRILDASIYGGSSINGTKATPVLSADLTGDWREEIIFRGKENNSLLLFSTTIPTSHTLHCLMSDRTYRLAVAWQNVVYNQPPHLLSWPERK